MIPSVPLVRATVSLREPPGQPVQVALDGGEFRPVPSFVAEAIKAQWDDSIELVVTDWGMYLELRGGGWRNNPARLRDAARMLLARAEAMARNGNGKDDNSTG